MPRVTEVFPSLEPAILAVAEISASTIVPSTSLEESTELAASLARVTEVLASLEPAILAVAEISTSTILPSTILAEVMELFGTAPTAANTTSAIVATTPVVGKVRLVAPVVVKTTSLAPVKVIELIRLASRSFLASAKFTVV